MQAPESPRHRLSSRRDAAKDPVQLEANPPYANHVRRFGGLIRSPGRSIDVIVFALFFEG